MRKYTSLILLLLSLAVHAQSVPRMTKIADEYYDNDRFLEALEFYDKIASIDKRNYRAKYRLGICYVKSLQYGEAEQTFLELGSENDPANEYKAQALYRYASLLKTDSRFKASDSLLAHVIAITNDEELLKLARKQKEGCLLAMRQEKVDRGFSVRYMDDVNSKFHDFGAVLNLASGKLVLATTRNLSGTQFAGSQYEGVLPDLTTYENVRGKWRRAGNEDRFSQINSEWSEGAGSFTRDGNTFYFSSCRGERGSDCAIMVTYLEDGRWSDPIRLNDYINEPGTENKQPFITAGGDTLFFSSDRSGGHGGSDIWMSLRGIEPESWSPAINMGDAINTAENDITPYYSSAFNCLLFASNGHVGYGGYDLYAAKGESFFEPQIYNLGPPFNSALDDTYFNISDSIGFLSSNRADRKILNLYSFGVSEERLFLSLLISGESLIDGQIISRFRDVRSLDLFAFRVEDYQGYDLFEPEKRQKPKPSLIRAAQGGSSDEPVATTTTANNNAPEQNFYGSGAILGRAENSIDYEHVYFRFGSSQLQPVVKKSIDDLVAQLQPQSLHSIEILAYTDVDGSNEFNQKLSEARGAAIREYMMQKGIPGDLIVVRARGEGPLSSRTSWYSKMFSRRAEIIVNSNEPITLNRARPYAVRYESSVSTLEKQLQLEAGSLKKWNRFAGDTVEAGDIIRVGELKTVPSIKYFLEEKDLRNSFFIYTVKANETVASIARKYNTFEELLMEVNEIDDEVKAGDEIFIYRIR
ncbi:MAG: hypothetical protein Tsb0034_19780 [Ekhidna sp.]